MMAVELGCIFNKFYFIFLDFILYVTNKLNTLFQSQSPKIHQVYTDCISVYKAVVSCFFKREVTRRSDSELFSLDPGNLAFHVELHQVYFGSKITKVMLDPAFSSKPAAARQEVLQRCKDFLVSLAKELKKRLPINGVMRDLRFLQPQVAVSGDIASIVPLLEELPDIIQPELHQELDMQWRQMAMDSEIPNMLTGPKGELINVTEFWVNIGKKDGFALLSLLAKKLLSLPVSNVACERIFSQVNLLKTNQRNRFTVPGVAAHLFAKDGLREGEEKNCTNFEPTKSMKNKMNQDIYTKVQDILVNFPEDEDECREIEAIDIV